MEVLESYREIKTVVDRVIYYNTRTKWGVLSVRNTLENDPIFLDKKITLTGTFDAVYPGCEIIFSGEPETDQKYGVQILISSLRINRDIKSKEGIINFLAKSSIRGISIANAIKIYNKFRDNSIHIVLHETEKIKEISGIGEKTYLEVKSSITSCFEMEKLANFCVANGISFNVMHKLNEEFGEKTLNIIQDNIYSIIEITDEFSFNTIDEIAQKLGIKQNDKSRLKAALIYCTKNYVMASSSTGINIGELKRMFYKTIGVSDCTYFNAILNTLIQENLVIIDGSIVYWKYYYDKEEFSAKLLKHLLTVPVRKTINENIIKKVVRSFPFELNEQQVNAIRGIISSRVSILTGGPGTGKTTITKAIVDIFTESHINFILLSPTGKATRVLSNYTKYIASTIHKFLHAKSSNLEDIELPILQQDTAIIIDESSMLDILMLAKILEIAKFTPIRLILIGDKDQLPSVQVGNVLADVIGSGTCNVFNLTDIMRQSKNSHIIKYCSDINNGELISQCDYDDFEYTEFYDEEDLLLELESSYFKEVEKHGLSQVQIISPYKKGPLGTLELNRFISNFNRAERKQCGYAEGDKVMQIKNDYKNNIFNGECGVITDVANEDFIRVTFSRPSTPIQLKNFGLATLDDIHVYAKEDIPNIMLAYAATCHKSQGAEYSVVFVILDKSMGNYLLTKKLLYTAVSRGKEKVYIYATPGSLATCIKNTNEVPRTTKLLCLLGGDNI